MSFSLFCHFILSFTHSFSEFIHVYYLTIKPEEREAENSFSQSCVYFIYSDLSLSFRVKLIEKYIYNQFDKTKFQHHFALIIAIRP